MSKLKKILLVEDEPDIQAITKIALESVGDFDLMICSSGDEAVNRAIDYAPDLLLLDIMMPGMDGPTTLSALKKLPELKDIPVIFMTAKVQPSEIDSYRMLGALDVITKPFDPMKLADQIRTIWLNHSC